MKVLVTGGTGIIGEGAIAALLKRGHSVRLLSRNAEHDVARWPNGVQPWPADVTSEDELLRAGDGCEAVLHVVGIASEKPPELTFEKVNIQGTRNVVAEAERAGVRRLVFVSSLGSDTGSSDYHRSKQRAETTVRGFSGEWVIVRPGNVYGPGDEVVSLLLKMVRSMPAIPVVGSGAQRFQPVWFEDLGQALAEAVSVDDVAGRTLEVAGPDHTTMNDLLDRMAALTGRAPVRVPVPAMLASLGAFAASAAGLNFPITETHLTLLAEENIIAPDRENALTSVFGIAPTSLGEGLSKLVDEIPESRPQTGVGPLEHKRFYADISSSRYPARALRDVFCCSLHDVMPLEVGEERGAPLQLKKGTTFSVTLPVRGVISMRVEEVKPHRVTAATVEGHPLTGIVSFLFLKRGELVRFEVATWTRASTTVDRIGMAVAGSWLQDSNWHAVVSRVIELSGGSALEGVQSATETLEGEEARELEASVDRLITARVRGTKPDLARPTETPARTMRTARTGSARSKTQKAAASRPRTRRVPSPKGADAAVTRKAAAPRRVAPKNH